MLIGLTGAPGAGKDSAAAVLCAAGWRSIALADALRVEVAAAWGIDQRLLTNRTHKEAPTPQLAAGSANSALWLHWMSLRGESLLQPRSPRWALQQWGSFRRAADPDHWVRHVLQWVHYERQRPSAGPDANLVITDVRMPNEATHLRTVGARLLRVHRPDAGLHDPATADHESEHQAAALEVDGDIHNSGSLADLSAEVWRVVGGLLGNTPPKTTGTT